MPVRSVTHENVRGWNKRVPRLLVALGMPMTLLIAVASLPVDGNDPTIEQAASWSDFLGNSLVGVAILAAASAWYLPRVCLWVCSSLALITASVSGETYVQIFGAVWLVVAVTDAASLRRQVRLSEDWRDPHLSRDSLPLQHLSGRTRSMSAIGTALIIVAVGVFGSYLHERNDLRELDDRAITATAVVTGQDKFFDAVTMRVDDTKYEFLVDDAKEYPIGSKQEVFVDPTGEHRPYNHEDVNPSGTMLLPILMAVLLALGAAALVLPRRRLARLRDLADHGGDPARAVVVADPHSRGLLVYPIGHTPFRHPVALIPRPVPVWGSGFAVPARDFVRFADPTIGNTFNPYERHSPWDPQINRQTAESKPIEVWMLNPWDRSIFASPTEVFINGFRRDGSHVLVEHVDSQGTPHLWAASGPVRDPNTIRRLFARMTGRLPHGDSRA